MFLLPIMTKQYETRHMLLLYRRVFILLDITVLKDGSEVGIKIGNPEALNPDKPAEASKGVSVPPKQPQYQPKQTNAGNMYSNAINYF